MRPLLMLLISAIALVVLDCFIWTEARLERYVNTSSSEASETLHKYLAPAVEHDELVKDLDNQSNPSDYVKRHGKLVKVLDKLNLQDEKTAWMKHAVKNHGTFRHNTISNAYTFLIKLAIEENRDKDAATLFKGLYDLGLQKPADLRLIGNAITLARNSGLAELAIEMASKAHQISGPKMKERMAILGQLMDIHRKDGNTDALSKLRPVQAEYLSQLNVAKALAAEEKKFLKLVNQGKLIDAAAAAGKVFTAYPAGRKTARLMYLKLIEAAAGRNKYSILSDAWTDYSFAKPELSGKELGNLNKAFIATENAYLAQQMKDELEEFLHLGLKICPEGTAARKYFEGELWIRGGMKGTSPKPINLIAYRPDANVLADGAIDEEVYKGLEPLPGKFWVSYWPGSPDIAPAEKLALEIRIFYTDTELVIAAHAPEPYPNDMRMTLPAGENGSAWEDDSIEIFLSWSRNLSKWVKWTVTTQGAYHRGLYPKTRERTEFSHDSGADVGNNGYSIELKIPRRQIPLKGKLSGHIINFNLRRLRYLSGKMRNDLNSVDAKKAKAQAISWTRSDTKSHHPELFNFLKFE